MKRLKAALFLVIALVFMAPAVALMWFRVRGVSIVMDPFFQLWVWAAFLGGLSTMIWMTVVLLRGR